MRDVSSLKHLDLFSGLGGFSLGLEATGGFETVAFCDIEKFPRKVLKHHWPDVKQYKDIKELTYERLQEDGIGNIDIITGGYPCQPFSVAGRKKVSKIKDTSGQKCLDLSTNAGRLGSLEKTLLGILNSVSTPYLRTWRVKVTPRGRLVFQLLASVPTTKEKGSGLWRTPDNVAGGSNLPGIQRALDEGHLNRPSGQPIQIRLADQVREPRLCPTPTARDYKDSGPNSNYEKLKQKGRLAGIAGGSLNPTWVEWLMGYPKGWTDLKD